MKKPPSHYPRLSYAGYARVLAAMPGTAREIADKAGVNRNNCARICREMMQLQIAHRSGFVQVGIRNSAAAVYSRGAGLNATVPKTKDGARPRSKLIAFASIIRALEVGMTQTEIRDETGVTHTAVCRLLRVMRALDLVRIVRYELNRCGSKPAVWGLGGGKNAPKPRPKTRKVLNAEYSQRKAEARRARQILHALACRSNPFEMANV